MSEIGVGNNIKAEDFDWFGSSTTGNDSYAITIGGISSSYETGRVYSFKADVANTGAASLNINSIGAVAIKKNTSSDLDTGDITAGQIVSVVYDGTYFQLLTPARLPIWKTGATTRDLSTASGTQNIAHGLGRTPKFVRIIGYYNAAGGTSPNASPAMASYDGTTQASLTANVDDGNNARISTTFIVGNATTNRNTMVLTFDGTNIILTWTKAGSPTGTLYITWEAYA